MSNVVTTLMNEQKYIDQCKADGSSTQTKIIERMGEQQHVPK